jgi:hypothetical protein
MFVGDLRQCQRWVTQSSKIAFSHLTLRPHPLACNLFRFETHFSWHQGRSRDRIFQCRLPLVYQDSPEITNL